MQWPNFHPDLRVQLFPLVMATCIIIHSSFLTFPNQLKKPYITSLRRQNPFPIICRIRPLLPIPTSQRLLVSAMATGTLLESRPPALDSTSEPPPVFDGTTRLYISYKSPFAQRTWIARNYKGLEEAIKLVPINLQNRPAWYKEKVYPENKVPSLEHNNEVRGESLDLVKYIDAHFDGPSLLPDDAAKREFAEELISYCNEFNGTVGKAFTSKGDIEAEIGGTLDKLESALSKFDDGPFFLGQFSMVDIAYAPFIERFHPYFLDAKKYDITTGRPKLASWIEELNKIEAYTKTMYDTKELVETYKKRYG